MQAILLCCSHKSEWATFFFCFDFAQYISFMWRMAAWQKKITWEEYEEREKRDRERERVRETIREKRQWVWIFTGTAHSSIIHTLKSNITFRSIHLNAIVLVVQTIQTIQNHLYTNNICVIVSLSVSFSGIWRVYRLFGGFYNVRFILIVCIASCHEYLRRSMNWWSLNHFCIRNTE